jgi:RimJ/RimL family protein N-acetyltransferase
MDVTPTLETQRLVLRGWHERDFAPVAQFYADDAQSVFVGGPRSRRETSLWLMARVGQWAWRGYGAFAIEERDSGAFVGWCGVNHYVDMADPSVQYALMPDHRGKGYMTEAGRRALDFTFAASGRDRLATTIHAANKASQHTARQIGGVPDGTTAVEDGHRVDVWHFSPLGGGP